MKLLFAVICLLVPVSAHTGPPQVGLNSLRITPSSRVIAIGEVAAFSVVDDSGRPITDAQWSITEPIAELSMARDQSMNVTPKDIGRTVLTASANGVSAQAVVTILRPDQLKSTMIRWELSPLSGYSPLFVRQTVKVDGGPDFFDVEWSQKDPAIVRALKNDGRQIWMTRLSAMATPDSIKRQSLPVVGKTFLGNTIQENVNELLLLEGTNVMAVKTPPDTIARALGLNGRPLIVHDCGDGFGGFLFLQRDVALDQLVDLGADGKIAWQYRSAGRLAATWTINYDGDIGIVEESADPVGSSFIVINGKTGEVRFRIPFPNSSITVKNIKCDRNKILSNFRASPSGAPFTNLDGNMYLQVAFHKELAAAPCPSSEYFFDNTLSLLQVTPEGEATWRVFAQIHSDANGSYVAQPRLFAGESIPDGLGGVLAAWTYMFPGSKEGEKPHAEARISDLNASQQRDFTLPMPGWTPNPAAFSMKTWCLEIKTPYMQPTGIFSLSSRFQLARLTGLVTLQLET